MGSQGYIWRLTSPGLRQVLRRAERKRRTALRALLTAPFQLSGRLALAGCRRLWRYLCRRANRSILAGLSEAQLKDIGVARSEIPYAVWALEFERDRAQLRARHRAGEDGPHTGEQASGERPIEDVSRAADAQASGRLVPLPLRSAPPPKSGPQDRPGGLRAVVRVDRDAG